ncbi:MAG: outer membrane lipid asymmetry maintenance protein MlaD [Desulfobacteraceae bacterium]|nr:outer membrane lipid asymmetry maintenance protein MlaD [Desulfobacteraceae bacterium]MBC2751819.1 outer membrane lipid asymmetry maintenance protein MlaD [Desulfobacteraceae bacterium]
MKKASIETAVGLFVLIGILCVGYLTVKLGKMEILGKDYYSVDAQFDSVTGLKVGANVEMAGVPIGKVEAIALDPERQIARVRLKIQSSVVLTDDTIASVKTAGMIGDKYIKLSPGGSDLILKAGDTIIETESALDLEELISKYVFGGL